MENGVQSGCIENGHRVPQAYLTNVGRTPDAHGLDADDAKELDAERTDTAAFTSRPLGSLPPSSLCLVNHYSFS